MTGCVPYRISDRLYVAYSFDILLARLVDERDLPLILHRKVLVLYILLGWKDKKATKTSGDVGKTERER